MDTAMLERVAEQLAMRGVCLYTRRGRSRRDVLESALERYHAALQEGQAVFAYAFFVPPTKASGPESRLEVHGHHPPDVDERIERLLELCLLGQKVMVPETLP